MVQQEEENKKCPEKKFKVQLGNRSEVNEECD
jgi:hypothetical protein